MKLSNYIITYISCLLRPEKRKLIRLASKLKNKIGLEIGGPSKFFDLKSYFPVYVFADRIDGVNFSTETVWEGPIAEGNTYDYGGIKKGHQFIDEAAELENVRNDFYDFLLSCHSLEHVANPLKAIKRWAQVLKVGGLIVLVLPNKEHTFDVDRPYTKFEHLVDDFDQNTSENDATHFEEVLSLHKIEKDPSVRSREDLQHRVKNNFSNRCVHHHVFDLGLLEKILLHNKFKVIHQQKVAPFHLVMIGQKISV